MKKHYLAIDLGASSGRAILASFDGMCLLTEEISRFPNVMLSEGTHCYWDIHKLYENILDSLSAVAGKGIALESVGIDTWGVDFVCIDSDGRIMRLPYSYRDPHTDGASEIFFNRYSREKLYGKTGIQVMDFNSLFQFDTLNRNRDSVYDSCDKIAFIPDALGYMLTGNIVTEYTIATTGHIVNAESRMLDHEILETVGLNAGKFGQLVYPGTVIGTLAPHVMERTGLGPVPVVAVAGHDTASAVAAVPAQNPNFAYLSSGTWSLMGIETQMPVINARNRELNFTNEGGVEGTTRLLKNICGMWLLEQCRHAWDDADYITLISEAKVSEPFRSLINPDDPCFANPADMPQAIADYCANTRQPVPQTRGQFVRCIFESLALRYRQILDMLRTLATHPIEVLHVIGGGSRNAVLNQMTANAVGISVVAGPAEATALGNIAIQAIAAGDAQNIKAMRNVIRNSVQLAAFHPIDTEEWDIVYRKFLSIIQ